MSNFINQNIYPKDRHNVFSEFLEYFGNIFDIDNFIKTYQNYLTDDELLELKNQFPHFKELADSLNKFFSNISGLNDDSYHFNVGMIPLELNELKKEDLHQENQYGDWNKQKIQFNQGSLCVYSSLTPDPAIRDPKIGNSYVVFQRGSNDSFYIRLTGISREGYFKDSYKHYDLSWMKDIQEK